MYRFRHNFSPTWAVRLWRIILAACLLAGCNSGTQPTPLNTAAVGKPNILFILTDDQEIGSLAYMPKLQELVVKQGTQMTNFLVNVPVCCPSRANILLGQYSHNSQILTNGGYSSGGFKTFYERGLQEKTVALALQNAGYRTVLLGKYLNGYPKPLKPKHVPPGWTEWYSPVAGDPYSEYNYTLNENGKQVVYGDKPEDYMTDVLSAKAIDFLQRHAKEGAKHGQPFFMYLATYAPHAPPNPAPRHAGMFTELRTPHTPAFEEEDVSDKPEYVRQLEPFTAEQLTDMDNLYIKRLQSLQAVDEMIEKLVQTLQEMGQLENTYIVFSSDNGFHQGQHRLFAGKLAPYEEDIRVPFVVRGPGIPAGQSRSELAGNIDLAPTFTEIGSTHMPPECDGRSLLSIWRGGPAAPDWRQAFLVERWLTRAEEEASMSVSDGTLEPPDPTGTASIIQNFSPAFKALRAVNVVYIEYDTGEREYYDLRTDPNQMDNLAATADAQLLQRYSDWLAQLSACHAESCRAAEQSPPNLAQ